MYACECEKGRVNMCKSCVQAYMYECGENFTSNLTIIFVAVSLFCDNYFYGHDC